MEVIDAYLHSGLRKYLPIEDVQETMKAAGVSRAVIVQHLGEYDNSYIQSIVESQPDRFAGVCLVDHQQDDAESRLVALLSQDAFRGVRLTSAVLREAPGLFSAAADSGGIIVFYAPEGIAASAEALEAFLASRPECRFVVTHLGNPDAGKAPLFAEHQAIFRLSAYEGVHVQLSGMEMFCPYPHEPLYPLLEELGQVFGPQRLLWGSNYPVVGATEDYKKELGLLLDGHLPLPGEAIPNLAGENARRLWFSGVEGSPD